MMTTKITLLFFGALLLSLPLTAQKDVPGAADHPLISRYPGSVIAWYDVQAFSRYKIATGPVTGYRKIDEWLPVEGKVTRIYYELTGDNTVTEVYLNYLKAVKQNQFEILAEGMFGNRNREKTVGGRGWLEVYFAENPLPSGQDIRLLSGSATVGGSCFVAGKLERGGATTYVAITGTQYSSDKVLFLIDIIEVKAAIDDLIIVDPDAMRTQLEQTGKVALYGIYFDTGKWDIRPESQETLNAVAALLRKNPQMKLYIVGHTDDTGDLTMNLNLSRNRAQAVVDVLTGQFGIAKERLSSFGAGPHAPASTNRSAEGRQLNRRVELVERIP
jgi:outer membrane protein OmpA-like peptidoglycan-associated protein